mgnify:CR=1 FL=1
MKTLSFFSFVLILSTALSAQTIKCPKEDCGRFQSFIKAAKNAADKPDFNQAIIQYNAARVCCPSAAEAIDAEILKIFELIENQRKEADANADRAKKAESKTKSALDKAERLVSFFGFTQNRAWAYKNGKFAVIDRNGKQWTDFVFENPDAFQPNGYALARKGGFYLLVDTTGRTSREYDYLFPTNNGLYKVRKDKKYTFVDLKGEPLPGVGWYESIDTFLHGLAIVSNENKWGFINTQGAEAIKLKFSNVTSFTGDVAWATDEGDKWGLIDKRGKFVTQKEFSSGNFIKPGLSFARKPGKWGVIDKTGRIIVPPKYEQIGYFENGRALIIQDGKQGYINKDGQEIIPPKFNLITPVSEGLAAVEMDSLRGFVDTTGAFPFPLEFEKVTNFYEGLAAVKKTKAGKWGYIDKTGKFVIEPQFEVAYGFKDGLAWVLQSDKKKRLIDKTGKFVSETVVDDFRPFSENLAAVKIEDKWGFIDKKGNFAIQPKFANVYEFEDSLAAVKTDDKWGFIDHGGNTVISPQYKEIQSFEHKVAQASTQNGWGLINKKGEWLLKPQFEWLGGFQDGLAVVFNNNKDDYSKSRYGYIDTTGKLVLPLQYTTAASFSEGFAKVSIDSVYGVIDKSGKFIFKEPIGKKARMYSAFERGYDFHEGLLATVKNDKVGFIDQTGAWVIPPQFDEAYSCVEGRILVSLDGESGLLNNEGKFIKKIKSEYLIPLNDDLLMTRSNSDYYFGYGLINLKTDSVIESRFTTIKNFSDGIGWAATRKENDYRTLWGLIDENGQYVSESQTFSEIRDFEGDVAWVALEYSWGLIDKKGKMLLPAQINSFGNFSEDLAWAERDGLRGYVDKTGKWAILPRFEASNADEQGVYDYNERFQGYLKNSDSNNAFNDDPYYYENAGQPSDYLSQKIKTGDFSGGLAAVYENEHWGYINKKGAFVIQPQFDAAGNFSEGLAWVKKDKKWGLIDTGGVFVLQPRYEWGMAFSDGFAQFVSAGKFGLIDKSFVTVIEPEYEAIANFSEGLALLKKDGKWGYANMRGEVVIAPQFERAGDFLNGRARVEKFGEVFLINKKGQLIVEEEAVQQPLRIVPDDSRPSSGDRR